MKLTVRKLSFFLVSGLSLTLYTGCTEGNTQDKSSKLLVTSVALPAPTPAVAADPGTILNRQEVPILCYHQIRDYKPSDGKIAKDYIVPVAVFRQQMQSLADSGYHTISPDQLNDYLVYGKSLPSKPVMITFDDTRLDQYTSALPELNRHNFKAVFFIMTVSLGRPGYMSAEQVKHLSDNGHTIGSHTWDHKNVKKYTEEDWPKQVGKPSKQLQAITGKPVNYFAYPFGLWNKEAITGLKKFGFKGVFQLSDKRDQDDPLYSIRRIIVPGYSAATMQRCMKNSFKLSVPAKG
jgi:peptidoglycan/xylan/chitin deacetylase (PgdA/CDA1 family)